MPATRVALFRGINVGGNNKLPMKDLTEIFVRAGCTVVRSYIQSGNVIFQATERVSKKLPECVSAELRQQFGFEGRMVIRTTDEIRWVAENNPFPKEGAAAELLSVMFLSDPPNQSLIALLDPQRSPSDRFVVEGKTIFLYTPTGLAKTKLTNAFFDSKLKAFGTSRNWRTVLKLLELMGS